MEVPSTAFVVIIGVIFFPRCSLISVLALAPSYSFCPTAVEDVMKMTV